MLYCRADDQHSTKYSLECLYLSFLQQALLSPRDSERLTWNRTVNNTGGMGRNVALDLDVEHSINYLKQCMKNLGPIVTEQSVSRICKAEAGIRATMENLDNNLQRIGRSGGHTVPSLERDLDELIKRLVQNDAFHKQTIESRSYVHFPDFERDPFKGLDISATYKWINKHKKNINLGIKAR